MPNHDPTMEEPKTVTIGDRDLIVKPLKLKELRQVIPIISRLSGMNPAAMLEDEQLDNVLTILVIGFGRYNEGVTKDWLEENVEITQLPGLFDVIMTTSGFSQTKKNGEPGEALSR